MEEPSRGEERRGEKIWKSYAEFLELIRNPNDERHMHFMEWSGENFNPEQFSIETVNERLLGGNTNVK